jgi:hypothetical protein
MILAVLIMLTAVKAPDNGKPRGKTPRTVVLVLIAVWAVIGAPNTYASLSGIFHKGADGTSGDRLTQLSRIEWFPTEATVAEFRSRRLLEDQEKGKSF